MNCWDVETYFIQIQQACASYGETLCRTLFPHLVPLSLLLQVPLRLRLLGPMCSGVVFLICACDPVGFSSSIQSVEYVLTIASSIRLWPLSATLIVSDFDVLAYWQRLQVNSSRPCCIETPFSISARRVFLSLSPCRFSFISDASSKASCVPLHPRVELIWSLDLTGKEGFLLASVLFTLHFYISTWTVMGRISPYRRGASYHLTPNF